MTSRSGPACWDRRVSDPAALTLVVAAAPMAERAAEFAKVLASGGWSVSVATTPAALGWVDRESIVEVTGQPLLADYRRPDEPKRGPRPDVVIVCPATFNTLNKVASGISDNYALGVLNEAVASGVRVAAVPFVNDRLWGHPAWSDTLTRLAGCGVTLLDPHTGSPPPRAVGSGTGAEVAASFDPSWLVAIAAAASSQ